MISSDEALSRIFELTPQISDTESIPLIAAFDRVLAEAVVAERDQPPFPSSAMDGYAVRHQDIVRGIPLRIIGESAAGKAFKAPILQGEAVRIFTGAPVPDGADRIIIQEDAHLSCNRLRMADNAEQNRFIRPAGGDFEAGSQIDSHQRISPSTAALIAAMNVAEVSVVRKPDIAIIPTGDELRMPGAVLGADEIVASSGYGLAAILTAAGAKPRLMPIARDTENDLVSALRLAADADMVVTLGGASVGDRDLVLPAAISLGMELSFHKVSVRPGKPLLAGKLFDKPIIGLPGNPVSALVCCLVFVLPAVNAMLGLGRHRRQRHSAQLQSAIGPNGSREHFMRACWTDKGRDSTALHVFKQQDSSLLTVLANAEVLVIRPPGDPARMEGDNVDYIKFPNFS